MVLKRRNTTNRLARTIVLGAVAVVFAIIWLAEELGLDREELLDYLSTSVLFIGIFIVLALLGGVMLWLLKRLFSALRR